MLFLPVGGDGVLDAVKAEKLSVEIEPKIIIPMHYDAASLKKYLKEAGEEGVKPIEKLTLKRKDLEGKQGESIVLSIA